MLRGPAPALAAPAACLARYLHRLFLHSRLVLVFAALLSAPAVSAQNIATIKSVTGPVTVTHGNSRVSTAAGNGLQLNEIVRTGAKAGLRLVLLDGSELNIGSNTELRVILH